MIKYAQMPKSLGNVNLHINANTFSKNVKIYSLTKSSSRTVLV